MTVISILQSAQDELLSRAHFHPVFDSDGVFIAISELKVNTDHRLGTRAMRELLATQEVSDAAVLPNGFSVKQDRILRMPAPDAAHYLKPSKKYDAATGAFEPKVTINIPYDVAWTLFEGLFPGQYSVTVTELVTDSEDVLPAGATPEGRTPDNAPGRIFYARATIRLTVHLSDGQTRAFEGVGVAYDTVRMDKVGNVYAINNSRRTAEKGAVSDAKREALGALGPVFRRAFEDGDEMIERFEEKLTELLRTRNRRPIPSSSTSAAPRRLAPAHVVDAIEDERARGANEVPDDYTPFDAYQAQAKAIAVITPRAGAAQDANELDAVAVKDVVATETGATETGATETGTTETGATPANVADRGDPAKEVETPADAPTDHAAKAAPEVYHRMFLLSGRRSRQIAASAFIETLMEKIIDADTPQQARAIYENNCEIVAAINADAIKEIEAALAEIEGVEDGLPDFDMPAGDQAGDATDNQTDEVGVVAADPPQALGETDAALTQDSQTQPTESPWLIDATKERPIQALVQDYQTLLAKAKTTRDIEIILEINGAAARRIRGDMRKAMFASVEAARTRIG